MDERSKKAPHADAPVHGSGKAKVAKNTQAISDSRGARVGVVCVGASAGGLEAFTNLLKAVPPDTGLAIVFIQHLSPGAYEHARRDPDPGDLHAGLRGQRRAAGRAEPRLRHPARPHDGHREGRLQPQRPRHPATPPDRPVLGLARGRPGPPGHRRGPSGTATDGTLGLEAIKADGRHHLRPGRERPARRHAAQRHRRGVVDFVLPPGPRSPARSSASPAHPTVAEPADAPAATARARGQVLRLLRQETGVDFSHYKSNTLHRRIRRRMVLQKMTRLDGLRAPPAQSTPAEVEALYQDILISVTSFFRDPEAFEALKSQVFPAAVQGPLAPRPAAHLGARLLDRRGGLLAGHRAHGVRDRAPRAACRSRSSPPT